MSRSRTGLMILASAVVFSVSSPARADGSGSDSDAPATADMNLLTVPDIPALSALDATSNKIDRPDSASGLAASLANVVNKDGTLTAGAGIELSPRVFGVDKKWSYADYVGSMWRRMLTQSALSIGTAKAQAPAGAMAGTAISDLRGAIGLRLVIINDADPLLAPGYAGKVAWLRAQCADKPAGPERLKCENDMNDKYTGSVIIPWNAAGLFVAAAETWTFADSKLSNASKETLSLWTAGALPICHFGQIAGGLVWDQNWNANDRVAVSGRLRLGGDHYRFVGDGTWFVQKTDDTAADGQWAIGIEAKLSSAGWLTLSAGTDIGGPDKNAVSILSSLKYGFSPKPSWSPN